MVGYTINNTIGAYGYNIAHAYIVPCLLILAGVLTHHPYIMAAALVWTAHIALDRTLGYGLKFSTGFKNTHLGNL